MQGGFEMQKIIAGESSASDWLSEGPKVSFEEAFNEFLALKKLNGARPATIRMYELNIYFFYRSASEGGVICAEWATDERKRLLAWMEGDFGEAPKAARRNRLIVCVRAFWSWCMAQSWCDWWNENPSAGIRMLVEEPPIRDIDLDKIRQLKEAFESRVKKRPNHWESVRNLVLFNLQLDTGIRPAEAFRLVREDIEFNGSGRTVAGEISLAASKTKTRKARKLGVSNAVALQLQRFIDWHKRAFPSPTTPLFCTREGSSYTINAWGHQMKAVGGDLGILPYDLRHTFGTTLARQGINAQVLAKTMGHSVQMTERYIHLAEKDRRDIAECSPAALLAGGKASKIVGSKKGAIDCNEKRRVRGAFAASRFEI